MTHVINKYWEKRLQWEELILWDCVTLLFSASVDKTARNQVFAVVFVKWWPFSFSVVLSRLSLPFISLYFICRHPFGLTCSYYVLCVYPRYFILCLVPMASSMFAIYKVLCYFMTKYNSGVLCTLKSNLGRVKITSIL